MNYLVDSDWVVDYAATALYYDLILLTRNQKHFQRIPLLKAQFPMR